MKLLKFVLISVIYSLSFYLTLSEEITLEAGPVTCEYKNKDLDESYDINSDVKVECIDTSCIINGTGASINDGILSITAEGNYIIQGSLNGQIKIDVTEKDYIHLILNSVTINSNDGPAIYSSKADKITLTLIGNNTLSDSNNYTNVVDEEPDACIFIDSDLSINGPGSLTVTGNYGDAIRCKNDLKLINGNITVPSAVKKGIKAKNSLCIKDGTIDITSTGSAIKVTKDNDAKKGYIVIDGGNIALSTDVDALHAETHLTIRGGYIDIKKSAEGIEGQMIDILGGEIHVFATDDGINASKISNSTDTSFSDDFDKNRPEGNNFRNETSIPSMPDNDFKNGTSFPSMPDNDFKNGTSFPSRPDNDFKMPGDESASGTDGSVYINIVGGKTYVTVSGNDVDGIDSNGVLYIGGEAEVYVSINGGDIYGNMAALDAEGTNAIVSGATIIATSKGIFGGNMGEPPKDENREKMKGGKMNDNNTDSQESNDNNNNNNNNNKFIENTDNKDMNNDDDRNNGDMNKENRFGNMGGFGGMNENGTIYQPYIMTSIDSQNAGTQITIKDNNDNEIITYTPDVDYSTILASSPNMIAGETYTIITGESSVDVIASEPDSGSIKSPSVTTPNGSISGGLRIQPSILTIILIFFSFIMFI